jgi:hypothetical protein
LRCFRAGIINGKLLILKLELQTFSVARLLIGNH